MSTESIPNIAVIPARSGSTRLPRKNRRFLTEKQRLVQWTVLQAIRSELFGTIVVSTDSDEIWNDVGNAVGIIPGGWPSNHICIRIGGREQTICRHVRKPEHATTEAPMKAVLVDVVDYLRIYVGQRDPKVYKLVLMQPTTPFRFKPTMERVIDLCRPTTPFSFTAKTVPAYYEHDVNGLTAAGQSGRATLRLERGITPNGNLYVWLIEQNSFPPDCFTKFGTTFLKCKNAFENIDIDTLEDMQIAQAVASRYAHGCNLPAGFVSGNGLTDHD